MAGGEERLSSYESSPGKLRRFCSACGSHLVAEREGRPHVVLRVATLDEEPGERPRAHIWMSHDVPWLEHGGEAMASYPSMPSPKEIDRRRPVAYAAAPGRSGKRVAGRVGRFG